MRKEKIVVVDDSFTVRMSLKKQLENMGYDVDTVESGKEFYEYIGHKLPDLIILDRILPDVDGLEICHRLKIDECFKDIPVIIFTSKENLDEKMFGLEIGADNYFYKSTSPEELSTWVKRLIKAKNEKINVKNRLTNLEQAIKAEEDLVKLSSRELKRSYHEIERLHFNIIKLLVKTIEARDPYTKGHSENVSKYATIIAKELNFSGKDLRDIRFASLLHDIGKIGISDTLLHAPRKLSLNEFQIIMKHPVIGEEIVSELESLKHFGPIIRHHHENYDGTGYPDKIKGAQIPIQSRIIRIADFFDAIISNRVYRIAYSIDKAITLIKEGTGKQFDPDITNAFLKVLKKV